MDKTINIIALTQGKLLAGLTKAWVGSNNGSPIDLTRLPHHDHLGDGLEPKYLELKGSPPYIDFHYDNSTADYTSRIIEDSPGHLIIESEMSVEGAITFGYPDITRTNLGAASIDHAHEGMGLNVIQKTVSLHETVDFGVQAKLYLVTASTLRATIPGNAGGDNNTYQSGSSTYVRTVKYTTTSTSVTFTEGKVVGGGSTSSIGSINVIVLY